MQTSECDMNAHDLCVGESENEELCDCSCHGRSTISQSTTGRNSKGAIKRDAVVKDKA